MGRLLFFITNILLVIISGAIYVWYVMNFSQLESASKISKMAIIASMQTPYIIFAFAIFFLHIVTASFRSENAGLSTLFFCVYAGVYFIITAINVYTIKIYPAVMSHNLEIIYQVMSLGLFVMWVILQFKRPKENDPDLHINEFEHDTRARLRQQYR